MSSSDYTSASAYHCARRSNVSIAITIYHAGRCSFLNREIVALIRPRFRPNGTLSDRWRMMRFVKLIIFIIHDIIMSLLKWPCQSKVPSFFYFHMDRGGRKKKATKARTRSFLACFSCAGRRERMSKESGVSCARRLPLLNLRHHHADTMNFR
jgi:hypothetical protein